jgi:hypothetical protein
VPWPGASADSPVLHEEIDKLLVGERMKWQKVIVDNKIEMNRFDI